MTRAAPYDVAALAGAVEAITHGNAEALFDFPLSRDLVARHTAAD